MAGRRGLHGALIGAYSNIILNGILIVVHLIKLCKMKAVKQCRQEGRE